MAGIPDTRPKGKTIEAPPAELDFKVNGERVKLSSRTAMPKTRQAIPKPPKVPKMRQPDLSTSGRNPKSNATPASPHAAWTFARAAQLGVIVLFAFALFEGGAFFILIMAVVLGVLRQGDISKQMKPGWNQGWLTEQWFEQWLPSPDCPDCSQSIFDRSVPGQYAAEFDWTHILPARTCANCGHDHTVPATP